MTSALSIRRNQRPLQRQAFTLMELLLVLAILLVIAGIVVPKLAGRQKAASIDATRVSIEGVTQAIKLYQVDHDGEEPTTADGLAVLVNSSTKDPKWRGPYLEKLPVDAWGEDLQYRKPGVRNPNSFDIVSSGPDRTLGTDDDIGNWE